MHGSSRLSVDGKPNRHSQTSTADKNTAAPDNTDNNDADNNDADNDDASADWATLHRTDGSTETRRGEQTQRAP